MTVPDSGATRVTVPDSGTTRVPVPAAEIFKETTTYFGICPNLSIFSPSRLCITSRHTQRHAQGELVTFSNQELTRLKRTNRQQLGPNNAIMGDYINKEQLTAQLQQMQQQMLQMQQTIQAQQDAAEQAALKDESDCSKKGNSSDTQKIDELTAKVDQLLKNNQGHVFNMEQATAGQIQNQNQRQPQNNQQGEQVQAKGLNQVTTEMDTRMGNMFTELNNKYDNLAIHIRKIDVQLAQTVESFKRQQETLPGRTDKNPRTEHCNAIEQPFTETVLGAEEDTEQPASSAVTAPDESAETPPSRVYVPKVPYPIPPRHLMDPISEEHLIGFNKMVRKLPKELAFKDALQIRPLFKFFKNCRETQEEIKVLYTKALSTPALKVLSKVDDPRKFVFPCSIAGTTFKDALCDSGSCVNLVSKAIVDDLGIADVERSQLTLTFANSSRAVPYGTIRSLHVQERSDTLSMTLNALNSINIGDEGDRYEPVLKLQRISQLFQNMSTAVTSAEQESIKSRRAAELLLAEVNEVQERNDSMQEELSKCNYEIEQLFREKDAAEAAKIEAISRCENLSRVNNEEKKKLYAQVMSIGTNVNTLRKVLAGTNSCLADIFTMNMEFLHHLKANMESCAKQTGTHLSGWPQGSTGYFVDKEIFSRLSAALSNVNLHENPNGGNITEICGSLSRNLDQFVADVSHLEENVSKHLASWQEQVNTVSTSINTFFRSIGTDSEIAALGEKVALLHGACSSVLAEIESQTGSS
ncbi:hypothetical protein DY000_02036880 [Brassica cretica]|uniref:Retrotransposon gag domain-containing protein n=1 Tax=Brassica cretica TaxID=69181 RepID=A0ABQ7BP02_BRACR|nr:hypothetical protein DY000_02036880 [Brassica cretica]